ncbi:MAG: hypothetical protein ABL967_20920 [Bryobacteraceae bacterium]
MRVSVYFPGRASHPQKELADRQREARDGLVRLSVGVEDVEDLTAEPLEALN